MKFINSVILVILLAFGCGSGDRIMFIPGKTNIRVHNVSAFDFDSIEVSTTGDLVSYGSLRSGQKSQYHPFEKAYRYAYVRVVIDGEEFILQPIDYVGETPLGDGLFTYQIGLTALTDKWGLTINTVEN